MEIFNFIGAFFSKSILLSLGAAVAVGLDEHVVPAGEFLNGEAAALEEPVHDHGKGEGVVLVEGGPAVAVGLEVGKPGDGILEFGVFAFFLLEHKPSP